MYMRKNLRAVYVTYSINRFFTSCPVEIVKWSIELVLFGLLSCVHFLWVSWQAMISDICPHYCLPIEHWNPHVYSYICPSHTYMHICICKGTRIKHREFLFCGEWGTRIWSHITLPGEAIIAWAQSISHYFDGSFYHGVSWTIWLEVALNCNPSHLCLLIFYEYRYETLVLGFFCWCCYKLGLHRTIFFLWYWGLNLPVWYISCIFV
jgi:hypothetical protein